MVQGSFFVYRMNSGYIDCVSTIFLPILRAFEVASMVLQGITTKVHFARVYKIFLKYLHFSLIFDILTKYMNVCKIYSD